MNPRLCRGLLLVVGLAACAKDLSELAPYPCALDGGCPDGLACVAGKCARAVAGSICVPGITDCSPIGAGARCESGLCAAACVDGAGCAPGTVCTQRIGEGACLPDCSFTSNGTCPSGTFCTDLWYGQKRACTAAAASYDPSTVAPTATACWNCGSASYYGAGVVLCSDGRACPPNSRCVTDQQACACNAGFEAYNCSGALCTSTAPCSAPNYFCRPGISPTTNSSLALFSGNCTCKDGRYPGFTCGTTETCDWLCSMGCDPGAQNCPYDERSKCTIHNTLGGGIRTQCDEPTGAQGLEQLCTRDMSRPEGPLGWDDCAAGGICLRDGHATERRCNKLCKSSTACGPGEACVNLTAPALSPGVGWCTAAGCSLFGGGCAAGWTCQIDHSVEGLQTTRCRMAGTVPIQSACSLDADCGAGAHCDGTGTCRQLCDASHGCPMGLSCSFFSDAPSFGICR